MAVKRIVAQMYGYIICLVAVITFLINVGMIITAIFDLGDPLHARSYEKPSVASFEIYKMDVLGAQRTQTTTGIEQKQTASVYVPSDSTLRVMYETTRNDRIQSVKFQSRKTITANSLLLLVSIGLFAFHWNWLRKLAKQAE